MNFFLLKCSCILSVRVNFIIFIYILRGGAVHKLDLRTCDDILTGTAQLV